MTDWKAIAIHWHQESCACSDPVGHMESEATMENEAKVEAGDRALETARKWIDWQQVVLNGGPPCFYVEHGKFCLRAERWHIPEATHNYVSLAALIQSAMNAHERELAAKIRQEIKKVREKRGTGKFGKDEDGWWDVADEIEQTVERLLAERGEVSGT